MVNDKLTTYLKVETLHTNTYYVFKDWHLSFKRTEANQDSKQVLSNISVKKTQTIIGESITQEFVSSHAPTPWICPELLGEMDYFWKKGSSYCWKFELATLSTCILGYKMRRIPQPFGKHIILIPVHRFKTFMWTSLNTSLHKCILLSPIYRGTPFMTNTELTKSRLISNTRSWELALDNEPSLLQRAQVRISCIELEIIWKTIEIHLINHINNLKNHLNPVGCSAGGSTTYHWKYNSIVSLQMSPELDGSILITVLSRVRSLHRARDLVVSLCSSREVQFEKEKVVETTFLQYQTGDCTQRVCRQCTVMPSSIGSRYDMDGLRIWQHRIRWKIRFPM